MPNLAPAAASTAGAGRQQPGPCLRGARHRSHRAWCSACSSAVRYSPPTPAPRTCRTIGAAVEEGAQAYLNRQFRTLGIFVVLVFGLLFLLPADTVSVKLRPLAASSSSARSSRPSIGYLGMSPGRQGQRPRRLRRARDGNRDLGMRIAFRTGGTVGMATVGLGLLGAAVVVLVYKGDAPKVLEGFGFGAALLAMFMRVGGGIFTKAADVGADLVGKVEAGIPEDDPRNAATIADNVGDNVGDCAGMAADLFESYAVTLVAALILGSVALRRVRPGLPADHPGDRCGHRAARRVHHPGAARARTRSSAINRGFYISAVISAVLSVVAAFLYLPDLRRRRDRTPPTRARGRRRRRPAHPRRCSPSSSASCSPAIILWLTGHFTGTDKRPDPSTSPAPRCTGAGHRRARRASASASSRRSTPRSSSARRVYLRVPARRRLGRPGAVPRRAGRLRPAHHGRRHRRHGHLRPGLRQRAGHRRDVRRRRRGGRADPHRARRRRQHDQGDHQGHRDRHGRARGDRPVRLVHRRVADPRSSDLLDTDQITEAPEPVRPGRCSTSRSSRRARSSACSSARRSCSSSPAWPSTR